MHTVYGLVVDHGDGSSGIRWFLNSELVEKLLNEYHDEYYMNEGSPAETFYFPDNLDLVECGFDFSDNYYEEDDED